MCAYVCMCACVRVLEVLKNVDMVQSAVTILVVLGRPSNPPKTQVNLWRTCGPPPPPAGLQLGPAVPYRLRLALQLLHLPLQLFLPPLPRHLLQPQHRCLLHRGRRAGRRRMGNDQPSRVSGDRDGGHPDGREVEEGEIPK